MPKKPTRRKRQQTKRKARVHRAPIHRPVPDRRTAASENTPDERAKTLEELQEALLAAVRSGEFAVADDDTEEYDDEWDGEWEDEEDEAPTVDFEPDAERILLRTIGAILAGRSARPAYDIAARLLEREQLAPFDLCPGDSVIIGELVALGTILDFREGLMPPDPVAAVRWVHEYLGAEHGRQALRVADLLGHPDAPPFHEVQPPGEGEEPLLPALVLLLAGVTAGAEDGAASPPTPRAEDHRRAGG